jgi:hypothetical protein
MSEDEKSGPEKPPGPARLTAAALSALEEAEFRRLERDARAALPPEVGGREGPEPTRYGDWEKGGIATDF